MRFAFSSLFFVFTALFYSNYCANLREKDPCSIACLRSICRSLNERLQFWLRYIRHPLFKEGISICNSLSYEQMVCCPIEYIPEFSTPIRTDRVVGSAAIEFCRSLPRREPIPNTSAGRTDKEATKENDLDIRIFHGERVNTSDEYAFMALIGIGSDRSDRSEFNCGGALISERFILTAAHCVSDPKRQPNIVKLGSLYLNNYDKEVYFGIEKIYIHPDYMLGSFYNDIALIKLNVRSDTTGIRPICLHTENFQPREEFPAYVAGWGRTENASQSNYLLKAELSVVPLSTCRNDYAPVLPTRHLSRGILDSFICARGNGTDTCYGDSGGPLIYKYADEAFYVAGITAAGYGCGGTLPGLYTRVVYYLKFIEDIVWPQCCSYV